MVSHSGSKRGAFALLASCTLLLSCGPENEGILRLPLEPGAAPARIAITPSGTSLGFIGEQRTLVAQVVDPEGMPAAGLSFSWFSADPGIASVDAQGVVTAVAEGTARVVARLVNIADTVTVTVLRVPAEITLSTTELLFTELGASSTVVPTLVDGGGQGLPASQVAWSSADTSVATVSASGVVTAVAQGNTTVKGTAGGVQASVEVRVATGPSELDVDPPTITFTSLGDTVRLAGTVLDAAGGVLDGVQVTFLWGDTLVADVDSTGLVTATGVGNTTATVIGDTVRSTIPVSVTQEAATVTVEPAAGYTLVPGGMGTFTATAVDGNDNAIPDPTFAWTSTDPTVATVTSDGVVTAQQIAGTTMIVATADDAADTATVNVVIVPIDSVEVSPDSLEMEDGDQVQLTVRFFDDQGTELIGPTADYTSSDEGVATVTSSGTVTAVDPGTAWIHAALDNGVDSVFVQVFPVSLMDIEVRFVGDVPTQSVQDAFAAAEVRWERIVIGDLPDIPTSVAAGACGIDHPEVNETIDDVLIFAEITAIDGSGGTLGQAGPCFIRVDGSLAIVGTMQFDEADMADLEASGDLEAVILHEMGHVLTFGVGDPWTDVLIGAGSGNPYWPGAEAVTRYNQLGGTATLAVPVANTGGPGTRDAHWRESSLGRELMTGFLNSGGPNPLSAITIGAMEDMGYTVDFDQAETYTVGPAFRAGPVKLIELREGPMPPPRRIDARGRIIDPS